MAMKVTAAAVFKAAKAALKQLLTSNAADRVKARLLGKLAAQMQRDAMTLHRRAADTKDPAKAQRMLGNARFYCEKTAAEFAAAAGAM